MSKECTITDRRLLAALDYIDQKYIDDVFSIFKEPEAAGEPEKMTWRTPLKHWRQFAALAACIFLLSIASPLVNYIAEVISNFNAGAGSGTTEATTQAVEESSPLFWMYTPELEPLTQEQVDECNRVYRLKCCGTLEEFIATYPEGKEQYAKEAYYDVMFISTSRLDPYLGTFNDAIVSVWSTDATEYVEIVIGEYVIGFPTISGIIVYKDGEICDIVSAYEKGWLTDDNIKIISERLDKYYNAYHGGTN